MNELLKTALYWIKAGIAVIPIRFMDKKPDASLLPDGRWEDFQKRLPTEQEVALWFPGKLHNLGLITGWQNLVVIDFDNLDIYFQWSLWVTRTGGFTRRAVEMTYSVRTGRGVHVYFRTSQPEQNRKLKGIDIKARGGYVLIPPSIHPSGATYTVQQPGIPTMIEALSDVLPASYLLVNTEYPTNVKTAPKKVLPVNSDPWEVAAHGPDPSQDLIQQIRDYYRIEDMFSETEDTGRNRWKMTVCPFHDDKHPSLWIDTQRQICGCYAGCTPKPLDAINLFARLNGLSNRDAIFYLAKGL